ncbi:hypothetical protein V8J88_21005 [Massilia sp. W12]|uniref:hypothetical protein n=1 Tax=Massilia sp. W12 TaxID=3126507 RepID=UPI0030CF9160
MHQENPPQPQLTQRQKTFYALHNNLLQILLLMPFLKVVFVIRSDGPTGFGEVALKGLCLMLSLCALMGSWLFSLIIYRSNSARPFLRILCCAATLWLALLAGLSVWEFCEDSKGYCREWRLHLQA